MLLTFIANACCIYEERGYRLLADPWLTDGAFEGSWFHYPPLKTKAEDLLGVDALYISHLHPDHFDEVVIAQFRRDIPIVILDHGPNFLERKLTQLGFTNLFKIKDGEKRELGPFRLTMYAPFAKHVFHESELDNPLDSALVVETFGECIFNANDNTPTVEAAKRLAKEHPLITIAQLNYNAAGPYPACFQNLASDNKTYAHHALIERNLEHMAAISLALKPKYVMPFAGHYVLGGAHWFKNKYLGTTTWDYASRFLKRKGFRTIVLNEGMVFDLKRGKVRGEYEPIDTESQQHYASMTIGTKNYPHESDEAVTKEWLLENLPIARAKLWAAQERLNCFPNLDIYLRTRAGVFNIPLETRESFFLSEGCSKDIPYLACSMDDRLLKRILLRQAHWNNAEIGCHIDFFREPNDYSPDAHLLMSYFHL